MKKNEIIEESIERFKTRFWDRKDIGRPPVGIVEADSFLPVQYLRSKFINNNINIEDIENADIDTDHDFISKRRKIYNDDFIPFVAPWRAIPWLEAICGCQVHYSSGSMAPKQCVENVEDLLRIEDFKQGDWQDFLFQQTEWLTNNAAYDCWVSPTILRGPSDILAGMRGMDNFLTDLLVNAEILDNASFYLVDLTIEIIKKHFSYVEPHRGGYGHIYGYWSPQRTNVYQEDAAGMADPEIFREIFVKHNNKLVKHLDGNAFFHIHSTGFGHYKDVLAIEGLAGIEITIELNGPPMAELVDVFREILERSRLILFVDSHFEQLNELLKQIPHDGLYVLIPSRYIKTEQDYTTFINTNWRNR